MSLPHSDAVFVKGHLAETTEAFCDGHVSAFSFFGGIPQSILYDNTKIAIARILGDRTRVRTRRFTELHSNYLFDDKFGRPARGNDKGNVEGMVGYTRRNFMVPAPRYDSFDDLNAHLEQRCLERQGDKLRGHNQTIGDRLMSDLEALMGCPSRNMKPAIMSAHGPRRSRWCATGAIITRCRWLMRTTMFTCVGLCMKSSLAVETRSLRDTNDPTHQRI